jgi:hypothetical protein
MHRNPVKRRLVELPEQWRWSSYRFYLLDEAGPVRVKEDGERFHFGIGRPSFAAAGLRGTRPFAKNAKERGTHCVSDFIHSKPGPRNIKGRPFRSRLQLL